MNELNVVKITMLASLYTCICGSEKLWKFLSSLAGENFGFLMPLLVLFYLETSYLTEVRDFDSLNVNKSKMY